MPIIKIASVKHPIDMGRGLNEYFQSDYLMAMRQGKKKWMQALHRGDLTKWTNSQSSLNQKSRTVNIHSNGTRFCNCFRPGWFLVKTFDFFHNNYESRHPPHYVQFVRFRSAVFIHRFFLLLTCYLASDPRRKLCGFKRPTSTKFWCQKRPASSECGRTLSKLFYGSAH